MSSGSSREQIICPQGHIGGSIPRGTASDAIITQADLLIDDGGNRTCDGHYCLRCKAPITRYRNGRFSVHTARGWIGVHLTKKKKLRRVILLCCHFARNLAYYRAGWNAGQLRRRGSEFWVTVNGNFLDECVLEWSKLFGITASDRNGVHYWRNAVADKTHFEQEMFQQIDRTQFDSMLRMMAKYRNRFLAHLDEETTMRPPMLDIAKASVSFYHQYVVNNEVTAEEVSDLPANIEDYYTFCADEAEKIYEE
jgi:hypothetical protein